MENKYRVREVIYDDRTEFFPEFYNEIGRCKPDYISISEMHKKILDKGYDTMEKALYQIELHKNKQKPLGQNIIEEKIHNVE